MTTQRNYEILEYSELDFENYTLQGSDYQYCSSCGAFHDPDNSLWRCAYCSYLNQE